MAKKQTPTRKLAHATDDSTPGSIDPTAAVVALGRVVVARERANGNGGPEIDELEAHIDLLDGKEPVDDEG
jgi:hypothetical protein